MPADPLPEKRIFYDDLDTVRFGDSAADMARLAGGVTSLGSVMTGLLIGGVAPIFSQAQIFDCKPLLALATPAEEDPAQRADRLAFLKLARRGHLAVGLLEGDGQTGRLEGAPSLMNAFQASVANPGFLFSGWPELDRVPELRREVLESLSRPDGRLSPNLPDPVAARIEGLRDLDDALRGSASAFRLVRRPAQSLSGRVEAAIRDVGVGRDEDDGGGGDGRVTGEAIRRIAATVAARAKQDGVSLESRSGWYLVIDLESIERPGEKEELQALREIVDFSYNAMVGESLTNDGVSLTMRAKIAAEAAAGEFTPGQAPGERWADLVPDLGRGEWLRWSIIPDLMTEFEGLVSPESRLRELRTHKAEWIADFDKGHSWGISVRVALPSAVVGVTSTFASSVLGGTGVEQALATSALAGALTLVAATPGVRAFNEWREARLKKSLTARDDRAAVRTSAAAWLNWLRRPQ